MFNILERLKIFVILTSLSPLCMSMSEEKYQELMLSEYDILKVEALEAAASKEKTPFLAESERVFVLENAFFQSGNRFVESAGLKGLMLLSERGLYDITNGEQGEKFISALRGKIFTDQNLMPKYAYSVYKRINGVSDTELTNIISSAKSVALKDHLIRVAHSRGINSELIIDTLIDEINADFPSAAKEAASMMMALDPPPEKALPHIIKLITINRNYFADIRLVGMLTAYDDKLLPYRGDIYAIVVVK